MFVDGLREAIRLAREAVCSAELAEATARDAVIWFDMFAELNRVVSAGCTLAGRRVEATRAWHGSGYPNPAAWMAAHAQVTLGSAVATLETARRLEVLPATRDAFTSGSLSAQQAEEIASAAAADPAAEASLLEAAAKDSVKSLRQQCRQVIAAASNDLDADERIRRSRYLRFWTDAKGSRQMQGSFPPDGVAKLEALVEARAAVLYDEARKAGSNERRECYAADALMGLTDSSTPGVKTVVNVHVDFDALMRGHLEPGEECAVEGIGPVSVPAAQRLADDAYVRAVLHHGADVRAINTISRPIPARLRAALEVRDKTCVVPGCDATDGLEIHHIIPVCQGGRTCMENCCRACLWHHMLVTRGYFRIKGKPGDWRFVKTRPRALIKPG